MGTGPFPHGPIRSVAVQPVCGASSGFVRGCSNLSGYFREFRVGATAGRPAPARSPGADSRASLFNHFRRLAVGIVDRLGYLRLRLFGGFQPILLALLASLLGRDPLRLARP